MAWQRYGAVSCFLLSESKASVSRNYFCIPVHIMPASSGALGRRNPVVSTGGGDKRMEAVVEEHKEAGDGFP